MTPFSNLSNDELSKRLKRQFGDQVLFQEITNRLCDPHHGHADSVKIESDEDGFELHVTDDGGERHVFNIHGVAWDFETNVRETISSWKAEAEDARATYRPPVTEADLEAYDLDDPKRVELQRAIDRGGV